MTAHSLCTFDVAALYSALDAKRAEFDLSWRQVADQLWDLSADLNEQRRDHPISPSTITNMAKNPRISCQHALFMLRWLDRTPESFLKGAAARSPGALCLRQDPTAVCAGASRCCTRPWTTSDDNGN